MHNKRKQIKMEKLNTKVERYIQLSIQFQKSTSDIFKEDLYSTMGQYVTINDCTSYALSSKHEIKFLSRIEKAKQKAEGDIKLAEDYEEYIQLQQDLKQYYSALNKIINKLN